jgi:hypothetical protein
LRVADEGVASCAVSLSHHATAHPETTPTLAPAAQRNATPPEHPVPSRAARLAAALHRTAELPPATTALEAYRQIAQSINEIEDHWWGPEHWQPPRSFLDGTRTARLYPIYAESFFPVEGFPGVTLLLAKRELLFISRFGAIELQCKQWNNAVIEQADYPERSVDAIFAKADAGGDGVWHAKNAH